MTEAQTGVLDEIDVVVFDAFGTLVEIADRHRPFAPLMRKMTPEKVLRFCRMAMTTNLTLAELTAEIEGGATVADLVVAQTAIAHEVASVRIRDGVAEMLAALPITYGVCSNLSVDYSGALALLPEINPAFRILSYEVGCKKPDPAIYQHVIRAAGVHPNHILFTGDTLAADIEGPTQAGMRAIHIDELIRALTGRGAGPGRPDAFASAFRAARGSVSKNLDIES